MQGGHGRTRFQTKLMPLTVGNTDKGFTIIEVLIVLAVTSFMLISAVYLISNKQNQTSFDQSIRNVQTELQQVASDVASGYYQSDGNISCTSTSGLPKLTDTAADLGTNDGCVFLGKMVQYGVAPLADPQTYNIYTIAGLQGTQLAPSTDLISAKSRLIARGSAATEASVPDVYDTKQLQYGLTLSKMYYNNNQTNPIRAFGFVSSLKTIGADDTSQQDDIVVIPVGTIAADKVAAVDGINTALLDGSAVVNPADGVQLCFNSGGTDQSGLITVGGHGRQSGLIDLKIFSTQDCI